MNLPKLDHKFLSQNELGKQHYPIKVIQFGTGALLRGLVDYVIHQSNQAGEFQGSVVAVGSTGSGRTQILNEQNCLFTHWIEGVKDGQESRHAVINQAISQAYSAVDNWEKVLEVAELPEIQLIVSNTTEVGIQYIEEDIFQSPPASYPAKLTALLYRRWKKHPNNPLAILPTELVLDNGNQLKEIVLRHVDREKLEDGFANYLNEQVAFCNTLVDRIVTGRPEKEKFIKISEELGYEDQMLTVSEPYLLWAIEGSNHLKSLLPFSQSMEEVILTEDIAPYRERKLRLLNGSHTISVALGYLAGFESIHDCMSDPHMGEFISDVMKDEIAYSLPIEIPDTLSFADEVLNRFRNPFLNHKLLDIAFQYTTKMAMRNVASILRYQEKTQKIPEKMSLGFSAYLVFLRPTKVGERKSEGSWQSKPYPITDKQAAWLKGKWDNFEHDNSREWLKDVFSHVEIWGEDLGKYKDWLDRVDHHLRRILTEGVKWD
ncbi:MAG: tagaturonate reductase [Bacteroidia bacterium]|nr:tagaturonate reductase [Bacteroidia bacterium]